jgi:general secretion pathway protein F
MPTYGYKATNIEGEVVEGFMDAAQESVVVKHLQGLGLIPIQINSKDERQEHLLGTCLRFSFKRVTGSELVAFTSELASLLKAGIPLDRSLKILSNNMSEKRGLYSVIMDVRSKIVEGSSLAEAMVTHPKVFSRLYVSMVRSGELSGELDGIMDKLAEFLERSQELRGDVFSAMIYPALLTFVSGVSILILLVFVVPKFASMFSDIGVPLPLPTAILLGISSFIASYWWISLICTVLVLFGLRKYVRTPSGSLAWDGFKLRMPVFGGLIQRIEVARFARTMGTVLKGGVPILESLNIVKGVVSNSVIADTIQELYGRVKRGEGIGSSLKGKSFIPSLAVEMISVGEETGRLQEILIEIADTFDKQVRERLKRLLSLMEPILILIMGIVVGTIVVSMLLALFSVNEIPF